MAIEEITAVTTGDPIVEAPEVSTEGDGPASVPIEIVQDAIAETDQPRQNGKLEEKRLSTPPPSATKVHQAAWSTFPSPEKETLEQMVRLEASTAAKLRAKEAHSQELLKKMGNLLSVSQKLLALPDSNAKLDEETCNLLKESGIWKEEFEKYKKEISKEQVTELKSLSNNFREKYHSENHMDITAMQNYASSVLAILEQANGMNRKHNHLLEVISRNSAPK